MAIIGKGDQGARFTNDDRVKSDRQGTGMRREQRGMDAHPAFDFSEEALLALDASALDGLDAVEGNADEHTKRDDSKPQEESAQKTSERVLATAGGHHSAQAVQQTDPVAQVVSVALDSGASIDAIMARIEQAVRAGLHPGADTPITLKIHLDDMKIAGLKSLSISMTSSALDVTLTGDGGDLSPEIIAATQALANQLAARFPNRAVRVLDSPAEASGDDSENATGMRAISNLLSQRGGAS